MSRRRSSPKPRAASPPPPPAARARYVWPVLIVVAGALVYSNSFSNPFILDDQRSVVDNPQIRQLWPLSVPLSPPDETPVARRPLVNLSLAINYAIGGLDVRGYHAVNLLIHLLGALVLFGLVRRALMLGDLQTRFAGSAALLAGTSALLWTIHPIQTELVNYVSQRTTSLKGLFYLVTLYCCVRALRPGAARWGAAAVLACAAGMAAKESMVTAPAAVVLFDRIFVFGSLREAFRRRGTLYAGLAATWVVLAALMASGARTTVGFNAGTSAWTYLLNQASVVVEYLLLVVWPRPLVVDYGMPQELTVAEVLGPGLLIVCLAAASVAALKYKPRAGFLGAMFFLTLAPTSSVVPIATEVGAERRMYLALGAIIILAVCVAHLAWRAALPRIVARLSNMPVEPRHVGVWVGRVAIGITAVLLAIGTLARNAEYQSHLTLASTTVERRPHGRAYFTLGHALFEAGRRDDALGYFREAAKEFPAARFAIGTELLADGELDGAIRELRGFIEALPNNEAVASAHQMIGTALYVQGRLDEAIAELEIVLALSPRQPRAHGLMGEALFRRGTVSEALPYLQRAVVIDPADAEAHDLLGTALATSGRLPEAVDHFRRATELDPSLTRARANLIRAERLIGAGAREPIVAAGLSARGASGQDARD